jgi:hypothetical protein
MAMFGGISLIGPMLIMTLHKSTNTSLVTVSVATFGFALALAVGVTDSGGKGVLGATAAYCVCCCVGGLCWDKFIRDIGNISWDALCTRPN